MLAFKFNLSQICQVYVAYWELSCGSCNKWSALNKLQNKHLFKRIITDTVIVFLQKQSLFKIYTFSRMLKIVNNNVTNNACFLGKSSASFIMRHCPFCILLAWTLHCDSCILQISSYCTLSYILTPLNHISRYNWQALIDQYVRCHNCLHECYVAFMDMVHLTNKQQ